MASRLLSGVVDALSSAPGVLATLFVALAAGAAIRVHQRRDELQARVAMRDATKHEKIAKVFRADIQTSLIFPDDDSAETETCDIIEFEDGSIIVSPAGSGSAVAGWKYAGTKPAGFPKPGA